MKYLCTLFASRRKSVATAVLGLMLASPLFAHHSFAVFFDDARTISVTGTVVEFRFLNPHGVIRLDVVDKAGNKQVWKAETNSPIHPRATRLDQGQHQGRRGPHHRRLAIQGWRQLSAHAQCEACRWQSRWSACAGNGWGTEVKRLRVLLAGLAASLSVQAAPPDLSGFWNPMQQIEPDPVLSKLVPAGTAVMRDTGAAEFPLMESVA